MAWAKGLYYQRSVRENGAVVTRYYGTGPAALVVSLLHDEEREARRKARVAARAAEQEQSRRLSEEQAHGMAVRQMVGACLWALGFAKYDRHRWRKRGMRRIELARRDGCDSGPAPSPKAIKALAGKVVAKEPGALAEFTELAERWPVAVTRELASDLAWAAKVTLCSQLVKQRMDLATGLEVQMNLLERELAGDVPTPALRLLAQQVVFEWAVYWSLAAGMAHQGVGRAGAMELKRLSAAQRRFLSAAKTYEQLAALEGLLARPVAARVSIAAIGGGATHG